MGTQDKFDDDDELEIDFAEVFYELIGHWKLLIISTVLVAVIALVGSKFLVTPKYESTAALYVLSKSTSITSIADLQIGSNLANDYKEVINGRPVLEQVITNLGLKDTYDSLLGRVKLVNPTNSRIMEITVTDTVAENAKITADEIARVSANFIAEKMDQDPPNIIQYGYVDEKAVSPKTTRNTIIGAVIGLVLAMFVVIVGYLRNDSIVVPDDLENKVGIHVLGTLPKDVSEDDGENDKSSKKKRKKK